MPSSPSWGAWTYRGAGGANDHEGRPGGKGDVKAQNGADIRESRVGAGSGARFDDVVKIGWYVKDSKPEYLPTLRDVRNQS
jgi:hypothetical protein